MVCAAFADRGRVSRKIGLDLVSVGEVREALRAGDERYANRIYSPRELADCRAGEHGPIDAARLAMRFAGKEAVMKLLRPGTDDAVPWRSIEIREDGVSLAGRAATLAERRRMGAVSVSFSRLGEDVAAVAVAEMGEA